MPELHDVFATKEGLQRYNACAEQVMRVTMPDAEGCKAALKDLLLAVKELGKVVPMREAEAIAAECVGALKAVFSEGPSKFPEYISHIQILSEEIKRSVALFLSDGFVESTKIDIEQREQQKEEREMQQMIERARQSEPQEARIATKLKEDKMMQEKLLKEQEQLKLKEKELLAKTRKPNDFQRSASSEGSPSSSSSSFAEATIIRARERADVTYDSTSNMQRLTSSKSTLQDQLMAMKLAEINKTSTGSSTTLKPAKSNDYDDYDDKPSSNVRFQNNNGPPTRGGRHQMEDHDTANIFTIKKCRSCSGFLLPGQKILKCSACGIVCHASCYTSQLNDFVQCRT